MAKLEVGELNSSLAQYYYAVFSFSLVSLLCFRINLFYGLGYYLAPETKYKDEKIYPFLIKIIKRYSKVTLFSIIIETTLCFISLFCLVGSAIFVLYSVSSITWNG